MTPLAPLEIAADIIGRPGMPVPVPYGAKKPILLKWQDLRVTGETAPDYFNGLPMNVGILNGAPSNNRIDVDLDCAEAVHLALDFLPETNSISGRESNPRSHYWYISEIETTKYQDPVNGAMIAEVRGTGTQTLWPGSTHPSGELYTWDEDGEPAEVDPDELLRATGRLASAALLARHWPGQGSRQDAALALAGGLLRAQWSEDEAEHFIAAVAYAAGDEEMRMRAKTVCATVRTLERDKKVTGWPTLAGLVGDKVVTRVREWLRLNDSKPSEEPEAVLWPELHPKALYGLAGEFVRMVEPHSEADPAALLIQFLISFGSVCGRSAYFEVEADRHYMNIFTVLVGTTSAGRKGTSWGQVARPLKSVDEVWARACIASGLSSGEGLIWAVRDQIEQTKPIREKGRATGQYETIVVDEGVSDKRALVFEGEFASVLRVQGREGNTLSTTIRQAWDTGDLRVLTKNSPARSTGAHISIIGHITKDELQRCLDQTEAVNGYVNRFLWVCVRRSKFLPEGGQADRINFAPFINKLSEAVWFARETGEMQRDDAARELWRDIYCGLAEGSRGLLGAVTARAAAQVMRLSCIYALLDCSAWIKPQHLEAALAVWKYCEDSARYIFGNRTGDKLADDILQALRDAAPDGLTRTDISNLQGRNVNAGRISGALASLAEAGLAYSRSEKAENAKRPTERWFATATAYKAPNEFNELNEFNSEGGGLNSSNSFNSFRTQETINAGTQAEREEFEL